MLARVQARPPAAAHPWVSKIDVAWHGVAAFVTAADQQGRCARLQAAGAALRLAGSGSRHMAHAAACSYVTYTPVRAAPCA